MVSSFCTPANFSYNFDCRKLIYGEVSDNRGYMICSRCKVDKQESEFVHGKTKCLKCYNKCRDYYATNRDREIARAQKGNAKKERLVENAQKRRRVRENPVAYALWRVKTRAKQNDIPFDLTHDDIVIPEKCPVLGIRLEIGEGHAKDGSPSIDRLNPNLGYVRGNIRVISHKANTIKSNATLHELRSVVQYMESLGQ